MENSCKDCLDRTEGCHSSCERYKEYKEHLEMLKNQKSEILEFSRYSHSFSHRYKSKPVVRRKGKNGSEDYYS